MHLPLTGSPPDPVRLKVRSADGSERRRERDLSTRAAWGRLAAIAASVSVLCMVFSFSAPYRSLQSTLLGHLRSSLGCGGDAIVANNTSRAGSAGAGSPCRYGELPGWWHTSGGNNHSTWHTLSATCPLADRVTEYGVGVFARQAPQATAYELNLLMYGDSIDRYLLTDTCDIGGGRMDSCWPDPSKKNQTRECAKRQLVRCELPAISMGRQQIIGTSPEGPYFQDKKGGPVERVLKGWRTFTNETGRAPDMVIIASALWDIARLTAYYPGELGVKDDVPEDLIQGYMRNTSDVLAAIEGLAPPGTLLVFHNTAWIVREDHGDRGKHKRTHLGRHAHLLALNAGGRQAAMERGWTIVDVERMSAGYATTSAYMRDMQHPDVFFLNSVLNVYLNLWHDHARRCTSAESWAKCPTAIGADAENEPDGDIRPTGGPDT